MSYKKGYTLSISGNKWSSGNLVAVYPNASFSDPQRRHILLRPDRCYEIDGVEYIASTAGGICPLVKDTLK